MPDKIHLEEYLFLPALTHNAAIIAWGGFYFEVEGDLDDGEWELLEDDEIPGHSPARPGTIGISSKPYGAQAKVFVWKEGQPEGSPILAVNQNYTTVFDLEPDTEYRYRVVIVDDAGGEREWGVGTLRDWDFKEVGADGAMHVRPTPRQYDNRFRTFPAPDAQVSRLNFAVLGDYGRGVRKPSSGAKRQREIALALERAVETRDVRLILTTGDNVYRGGDDDEEWFYTYFQPYRYLINRIPVFPTFGNHDDAETEEADDRDQLYDNLHVLPHFTQVRDRRDASIHPGLFYRAAYGSDIEFICVDTSKDGLFGKRYFKKEEHREFIDRAFDPATAPTWRIPFFHHPPFSAGPQHRGKRQVRELMAERCEPGGVRVVFCGHEHNFQHASHAGIDYFVTGGGGEFRTRPPDADAFEDEETRAWGGNDEGHFLLVEIDGNQMKVSPLGHLDQNGQLRHIKINSVAGGQITPPFVI